MNLTAHGKFESPAEDARQNNLFIASEGNSLGILCFNFSIHLPVN